MDILALDSAITRLTRRIADLKALDTSIPIELLDVEADALVDKINATLVDIFGENSTEWKSFSINSLLNTPCSEDGYYSDKEIRQGYVLGIHAAASQIPSLIGVLVERAEAIRERMASTTDSTKGDLNTEKTGQLVPVPGKKVFIVHGRDDLAKVTTARLISDLGLQPIILHEQDNQGKSIIEKFEAHSDVAFAVVLLTPDDEGRLVGKPDELKPRARQNVVLEMGYFMGTLGRHNVCVLHKGNLELPSDVDGVVYVPMDDGDAWHFKLAREMKTAGLEVDLNKVI